MDIFFSSHKLEPKKKRFLTYEWSAIYQIEINVIFKHNPVSKTVEVNFLNMQQGLLEKSSLYFVCPFSVNWVTFFSCF